MLDAGGARRARALFVLLVNRRQTNPLSEDAHDIIIHGRPRRRSNGRSHLLFLLG
jgi:hypothetical protein